MRTGELSWDGYSGIHTVEILAVVLLTFSVAHSAITFIDLPAGRWLKRREGRARAASSAAAASAAAGAYHAAAKPPGKPVATAGAV